MVKEAARESQQRLDQRLRQFASGGFGPLLEVEPPQRPTRWRMLPATGGARLALLGAIMLCTGAGFASGQLWNGRNTDAMDLDLARQIAADTSMREDARKSALGRLQFYAYNAVQALRGATDDPDMKTDAEIYLRQLRVEGH